MPVIETVVEGADRVTYQRGDVLNTSAPRVEIRREPLPTSEANRRTILTQAAAALEANATFLAVASPTNAQNAAQIKALTRQVNKLIRLTIDKFDGTD